jgi:hypothetical protein
MSLAPQTCPACGRLDAPVSRWTGRIKRHVGRALGDAVFCRGDRDETRGGAK